MGSPFFFPRHAWIPLGEEFKGNIVSGKAFDTTNDAGAALWARVEHLIHRGLVHEAPPRDLPATYGQPALTSPRRGQGAFRALVTNAYSRRCAITGESTLPVLEAAHIKPVASSGLNNTFNGLLLRSDFHRLFDVGLVTVTPEHRVIVSGRIKEQWYNGKAYNNLHGRELAVLPEDVVDRPKADFLRWHNDNVFEQRFMSSP
ncbi:MAG: HNH endonuclease [Gemmatimonadaceae bacterium]|nr:HNH endonuclease [Gemmatimonadaceae bacterium]